MMIRDPRPEPAVGVLPVATGAAFPLRLRIVPVLPEPAIAA